MKVYVDQERCCGYKMCNEVCPEIYKIEELGLAYVEGEVVPRLLEGKALEGAKVCPQEAITVEETDEATPGE